jgi:hypothetical protein
MGGAVSVAPAASATREVTTRFSRHVVVVAAGMAPCGHVVVLMLWNPGVRLVHLEWSKIVLKCKQIFQFKHIKRKDLKRCKLVYIRY